MLLQKMDHILIINGSKSVSSIKEKSHVSMYGVALIVYVIMIYQITHVVLIQVHVEVPLALPEISVEAL